MNDNTNTTIPSDDLDQMSNAALWQLAREMGLSADGKIPEVKARIRKGREEGLDSSIKSSNSQETQSLKHEMVAAEDEGRESLLSEDEKSKATPTKAEKRPKTNAPTAPEKEVVVDPSVDVEASKAEDLARRVELEKENSKKATIANYTGPKELPEEAKESKATAAVVYGTNGYEVRRYTKETHGSEFKELAQQFVSDRAGMTVRYE